MKKPLNKRFLSSNVKNAAPCKGAAFLFGGMGRGRLVLVLVALDLRLCGDDR